MTVLVALAAAILVSALAVGQVIGARGSGAEPAPPPPQAVGIVALGSGDGDVFYREIELALGSDPNNPGSTPESHTLFDRDGNGVADVCEDFLDNDQDGSTDLQDPGCRKLRPSFDLGPGLDIFSSRAFITADAFGPGVPPVPLKLQGPMVVRRGEPSGGGISVEIVAMQLTGVSPGGPIILIEDPGRASTGGVRSETGGPPWESFFDLNTIILLGPDSGDVVAGQVRVINPGVEWFPPVQDSRNVDGAGCYRGPGVVICPVVPRLELVVFKWVAKFDCGTQPLTSPPFLGPVQPGDYATKIVIHNPRSVPTAFFKNVSEGRRNPEVGPRSDFEEGSLPLGATTEVDCADIFRLLGHPIPPRGEPLPFKNGVVDIFSLKTLDVIANYTQKFQHWRGLGSSMDVEAIQPQRCIVMVEEERVDCFEGGRR